MALVAFLLAVVHVPGITGLQMLSGYSFLSCVLPFFLLRRIEMTSGHWLGVFFLAYATLSLAWTPSRLDGIGALWHWVILGASFCLGFKLQSLRGVFIGLGLGVSVSGIVGLFQLAGYHPVMGVPTYQYAVFGLFYNPNVLSETAAIVLVGAIVYRIWWLVPGLALTMMMGQGRAAIAAICAVAVICFVPVKWRLRTILLSAAAVAFLVWFKGGMDSSIAVRLELLGTAYEHLTRAGQGVGSFFILLHDVPFFHLHNDFLEVVYEFGIGSLPFFLLILSLLITESHVKPILYCVLLISLFSFPLFMPVTGFVAALVAGHVYRSRYLVWEFGAVCRHRIHQRLGHWGYWAAENGGGDVSVRSAHSNWPCTICGGDVVRCALEPHEG